MSRTIEECNVAVVGGAGFLGSHIVDHLINDRNCKTLVIDNLVAGRLDFINPKATFVHHDITGSEEYLRRLFAAHGTRFVFNYAAYPYIPDSFARPLRVFDVNATAALKVINAAQEAGCEGILQVSSAEIYGSGLSDDGQIDESFPVIPHSTYGVAKAAVDSLVQVRWKERQTPAIALRQFNCIGERDITHPYVIPEIARQFHNSDQRDGMYYEIHLGNNSFRDFLYAGDQARIAVELLEEGEFGEVYNLGSEAGTKIYDLAHLIGKVMGIPRVAVKRDAERIRPWEIWHLLSDNSKIYSAVDARPEVNLEEALKRTIASFDELDWQFPW